MRNSLALKHVHAQADAGCAELIQDGSFEQSALGPVSGPWINTNESQPVAVTATNAWEGDKALQIGLVDGEATDGVSIVRQTVRLPEGNGAAILSFRYFPFANGTPNSGDLQYVEIFNDFNSQLISRVVERRSNDRAWQFKQFDLTPYAGQQITIYFAVRNDDEPPITAMLVDSVSLTSCNPVDGGNIESRSGNTPPGQVAPFLTSTETPTPTPTVTSTPSATSTSTPTPTPTPTTTGVGVTPVVCATSEPGPLSIAYNVASGNQSATINVSANNSTRIIVTGPNNFSYSRTQPGPYAVAVSLQPGNNVFTVSVIAERVNSNCLIDSVTLTAPVTIPSTGVVSCPTLTQEPFTVELLSTSEPLSKIIRVNIGNGDRVVVRGPLGTVERTGSSPFEIPVQVNANSVNTFQIDAHVRSIDLGNGCIVGNYTLRKSLTYDDSTSGPTATPTATAAPSTCGAIAMAPRPQGCRSILINGSFETNDGWHFGDDPVVPAYTNEQASVGARSVVLGNPPNRGPATAVTYSSIRQPVTIPANVEQLQLRWRRLDVSEEGATANPSGTDDRQDVIILSSYPHLEPIEIVSRLRCNASQWEEFAVNLDARRYAHDRKVVVYFNVFNDGQGGRTWSYLDNVELLVCPANGAYPEPNMGAVGKGSTYIQVEPPAFSPTSTYTPGPISRATYTPFAVVLPTATSTSTNSLGLSQNLDAQPTVITVVVTATPIAAVNVPAVTATDSNLVQDEQQPVDTASSDTTALVNNRTTGLASVDEVEATNQFLENRPWFNWLTSCGILLGILAVIGYFAWGILKTLADGTEHRNDS